MLLGTTGKKASPKHAALVGAFVARLSSILPWDRLAAEETIRIRKQLSAVGKTIGGNEMMIAEHALAANCVLVTNNVREFYRVKDLQVKDWTREA
jgi:tRNA(fMet)-specific endonuclease VapC